MGRGEFQDKRTKEQNILGDYRVEVGPCRIQVVLLLDGYRKEERHVSILFPFFHPSSLFGCLESYCLGAMSSICTLYKLFSLNANHTIFLVNKSNKIKFVKFVLLSKKQRAEKVACSRHPPLQISQSKLQIYRNLGVRIRNCFSL